MYNINHFLQYCTEFVKHIEQLQKIFFLIYLLNIILIKLSLK
jgi:hypothetical protein